MIGLKALVVEGEDEAAAERVAVLLKQGKSPADILNNALIAAMDEVGDRYQKGDFFLPELMIAGKAMQAQGRPRRKLPGGEAHSGQLPQGPLPHQVLCVEVI